MALIPAAIRASRRQAGRSPVGSEDGLSEISEEASEPSSPTALSVQCGQGSASAAHTNAALEISEEVPQVSTADLLVALNRLSTGLSALSEKVVSLEETRSQQHPEPRQQVPPQRGIAPNDDDIDSTAIVSRRAPAPSFVDHARFRHRIATGFEQQSPSPHADPRPHVYNFDDAVSRSLIGTKFTAKLQEYRLVCVNGFFMSCANAALLEVVESLVPGSSEHTALAQVYNSFSVLEDLGRDRKTFLACLSDPSSSESMRAYANTILRTRFESDLAVHGASGSANENFNDWQQQVVKSTIYAAAKVQAEKNVKTWSANQPRQQQQQQVEDKGEKPDYKKKKGTDKGGKREDPKKGQKGEPESGSA